MNIIEPELLSPAGDFECLKAAVQNGADSVYLGTDSLVPELQLKILMITNCKKQSNIVNFVE